MSDQEGLSERAAFDRLYHEQGSHVCNFLRLSIGNSSVADDLTQDTFLHFWRRRGAFDPERGGVKAYLLGIARKKAADWWRRNKGIAAPITEPISSATDRLIMLDAMNRLPEEVRTVLWLREVDGYSYKELADIFNVPLGTVRSRLHVARQQLRTIWAKEA